MALISLVNIVCLFSLISANHGRSNIIKRPRRNSTATINILDGGSNNNGNGIEGDGGGPAHIVNGEPLERDAHRYLVSIGNDDRQGRPEHACGGSYVSERAVLSAARKFSCLFVHLFDHYMFVFCNTLYASIKLTCIHSTGTI